MFDVGWTQAGQVLDGFGALVIALGAVATGDAEIERSADPGLGEVGDVLGMVLLRQDNRIGGVFLLCGFIGQLLAPALPDIPPEGLVIVCTGAVYLVGYLRARRRMATRAADRIRRRLKGRTQNEVTALAIAFASAM